VFVAIFFGLLGYFLRRHGYPLISLVIGLILGRLAEGSFHQALMISDHDYSVFILRPLSAAIFALCLLLVLWPGVKKRLGPGAGAEAGRANPPMHDSDIKKLLEPRISRARAKELLIALVKVPSPQTERLEDEPLLKAFITSAIEPRLRTMGFVDIRYDAMGNL